MSEPKMRVVFCGTPDFAIPSLVVLHGHSSVELIHIISMPDRPAGRGQLLKSPPVIEFAQKNNIPYTQTQNLNLEHSLIEELKNKTDVIIVLAFAQFLKKVWLNLPIKGCFNIHTSLLPKYRGAAPIQYALLNGDSVTGVSIQKMVSKMDAGDVVYEEKVAIQPDDSLATLSARLSEASALALKNFLPLVMHNQLKPRIQNEADVSFAPEISKEMGYVDWTTITQVELLRKIKALAAWPGVYFFLNQKRFKIHSCIVPKPLTLFMLKPGEIKNINQQLIVGCSDGPIRLNLVQIEGKEKTSDEQFLRGFKEPLLVTKDVK